MTWDDDDGIDWYAGGPVVMSGDWDVDQYLVQYADHPRDEIVERTKWEEYWKMWKYHSTQKPDGKWHLIFDWGDQTADSLDLFDDKYLNAARFIISNVGIIYVRHEEECVLAHGLVEECEATKAWRQMMDDHIHEGCLTADEDMYLPGPYESPNGQMHDFLNSMSEGEELTTALPAHHDIDPSMNVCKKCKRTIGQIQEDPYKECLIEIDFSIITRGVLGVS